MRNFLRRTFVLCAFLASSSLLPAQTFGEITGTVLDPTGAVVTGAEVTVTGTATNATRSTRTNQAGNYVFPNLLPAIYDIKVEMSGFSTATSSGIELQVQQVRRADFTLQVGDVTQVIEVAANAAILDTDSATVGTVIENRRIVDLPLNGRNYLQLVALTPNVSFGFPTSGTAEGRQGGQRTRQNISIAGQRSSLNRFTLDGVENTDVNFGTYIFLPSIDALQEFKVQSGIAPAEFGRQLGQIIVSTKSGSNQFHGALFEFLRNDKFDAKEFAFTANRPEKSPFRFNQYGATVGGPIWRNRIFFLSNYEGLRDRKAQRALRDVPSVAMQSGNFSEISSVIYDPKSRVGAPGSVTATPFPNNIIPSNQLHRTSKQLLEFIGQPNVNTGNLVSNFQSTVSRRIDRDQFTQRIDWVESSKSNWFGRYSYSDEEEVAPGPLKDGSKLTSNLKQIVVSNTRVFSPTLINDFRYGYNSFFNSNGSELSFERDVLAELAIPGLPNFGPSSWGVPTLNITGFGDRGNGTNGPDVADNTRNQFIDNVSWIRGSHSFRMGVEVLADQFNVMGNAFTRGAFGFSGNATQNPISRPGTGYGFGDFMLGVMNSSSSVLALGQVNFRAVSQYYFFDDTWKITPRLTINVGLRYENTPPYKDQLGNSISVNLPCGIQTQSAIADPNCHPVLVRIGSGDFYEGLLLRFNPAIRTARDGRLGDRLVARDNNDLAPRIGFAWSPTQKWTLRSGFGVFYSQDQGNARWDMGRNLAGRRDETGSPDFPNLSWDKISENPTSTVQINTPFTFAGAPGRRTPYTLQWMFNIQRELQEGTLLELGYVGSASRKFEFLNGYNYAPPEATGAVQARRPYPELGAIQFVENFGMGSYHGASLKLQRRFSQGLTYLASYTFSRSIDTTSGLRSNGNDVTFPQNPYDAFADKGLSSFHAKHRFVLSTLYELPWGKGRKYLNQGGVSNVLLGGWQVGSIVTFMSGNPMNLRCGCSVSNTGNFNDRTNVNGQPVVLDSGQRNTDRWFNTSAFFVQPFGQFGNAGRNVGITPGLAQWDFSVQKSFPIVEGHHLEFRFEAFNFTNNANFERPGFQVMDTNFGVIRGIRVPMREMQFALKYIF